MSKYPSTLLATFAEKLEKISDAAVRREIETEIRKADLDLLDKINQLAQTLSALTTTVNGIPVVKSYAPLPQAAAGVGQAQQITAASGSALSLPAGGTWWWWGNYYSFAANTVFFTGSTGAFGVAGGTQILAAVAGNVPFATVWRIA